jgi:hypothetical protein
MHGTMNVKDIISLHCFNLYKETVFHVKFTKFQIIKAFYSQTDAQLDSLKNDFKIYIKIDINRLLHVSAWKTPSSGSALFEPY